MKNANLFASHSAELPAPSPEAPAAPKWIQLLPPHTFSGRDGRGPYRVDDPEAVIAATREYFGNADIPLDYNHQTEHAAENGKPAPAAGWIKKLEGSNCYGLWGRVEWTEAGARAVAAKEFRYVSPVFFHDKDGRVLMIRSAALTNLPNLDLKALSSAQTGASVNICKEHDMNFKEAMAQSLGLSPDAGEAEIIAAAQSMRDAVTQTGKTLNASEGLAGLIRAAHEVAAKAARADKPDPARFVPMSMRPSARRMRTPLPGSRTWRAGSSSSSARASPVRIRPTARWP